MLPTLPVTEIVHTPLRPADQNPVIVYVGSLAPGSRRTIRTALQLVVDTITGQRSVPIEQFPWWTLQNHHIMKVRTELLETHAPATINKAMIATRQVLVFCRRLGLMTAEACAQAGDLKSVRNYRLPAGRALNPEEIERLFALLPLTTALGIRNRAILSTLVYTGLRRTEITTLTLQDYDVEAATLRVHGKGNKERLVPVSGTLSRSLAAWLSLRGTVPGTLFERHRQPGRPLSDVSIYRLLQRLAKRARVAKISPHDFRRTFISALLERPENDLTTVSKLVGHASVQTTARYDRRDEKNQRRAVESLREYGTT